MLSRVQLFVTPWTVALQAPLSMGFSRPEYWSGLPCPPPGDLPDPGIKPGSPVLAGRFFTMSHQGSPEISLEISKFMNQHSRAARRNTAMIQTHFSCKNLFGRSCTDGDLFYKRCFPQDYVTGKLIQSRPWSFLLLSESLVVTCKFSRLTRM